MLEHERLREAACGCRYDVVTGLYVFLCGGHDGMDASLRDPARLRRAPTTEG